MHFEHEDFRKIFRLLNRYQVEFMIIGGYAVIFHGYHRTTGDLDIWLKPTEENKVKLSKALKDYPIEDEDVEKVLSKDFSEQVVFHIGEKPWKIEFMTHLSGIKYSEAEKLMIRQEMNDITVYFIDALHLKVNKFHSGRLQDMADLDELEKIAKHKSKD